MKVLLTIGILFSINANAAIDQCVTDLHNRIAYVFNEGGLRIKNLVGPIHFNEGSAQGGLVQKVAYAVDVLNDPQVNPNDHDRKIIVVAECSHDEPSRAVDKNKDGEFNLKDAMIVGE